MQAEMQRLKEKLAISERTAKAESQLKVTFSFHESVQIEFLVITNVIWYFFQDKLKLRLKTLEEGLKHFSNSSNSGSAKAEKSNILSFLTTSGGLRNRSTSQPRGSTAGSSLFPKTNVKNNIDSVTANLLPSSILRKKRGSAENLLKKGIWASLNKVVDSDEKENKMQVNASINSNKRSDEREAAQIKTAVEDDEDSKSNSYNGNDLGTNDVVSGFLYDKLQKEVINLRKSCEIKESSLQTKEEEIKVLVIAMPTTLRLIILELKIGNMLLFSDAHKESRCTDKGYGNRVEENEKGSSC